MDLAEARQLLALGEDPVLVLRRVWHLLDGGRTSGMAGSKLERIENPRWRDPVITFEIDRHGSFEGERQTWKVDLAKGSARCVDERWLGSKPEPLRGAWDERPLAEELAQLIRAGDQDSRLRWRDERREAVKIAYHEALPPGTNSDTPKRAKRLRIAVAEALGADWQHDAGWLVRAREAG